RLSPGHHCAWRRDGHERTRPGSVASTARKSRRNVPGFETWLPPVSRDGDRPRALKPCSAGCGRVFPFADIDGLTGAVRYRRQEEELAELVHPQLAISLAAH